MASSPVFLEHPTSLEHDTGAHPEQAARISAIQRELEPRGWLGFTRESSPQVEQEILSAVHPAEYIDAIAAVAARGGGQLDLDTVMSARSYDAALHAAGGAVRLVELLLSGQVPTGFSAHRPPGHHASQARAMGFCLFNNIAVAARHALDSLGLDRVMVLDWDVHHGNGTSDIFHDTDELLLVSIHQSPLYPGTGPAGDNGSGRGEGYTVNIPVPPRSDDTLYTSVIDHVVVPLTRAFRPQLLLISAGYDAHLEDPLAECHVTEAGFAAMTRSIRRVCTEVGAPIGCVLEGGYALGALARSVAATLEALNGPLPESDGEARRAVAQVAASTLDRLQPFWGHLA
jgi:acetoin utilization deacetylase AcuC-like enzyme